LNAQILPRFSIAAVSQHCLLDFGSTFLKCAGNSDEFFATIGSIKMNRERRSLLLVLFCLCLWSCDSKLFGPDTKEIAGGYRLKRTGDPNQFSLTIPYQTGGLIIDEIGWREPIIIAKAWGSDYWEAINTARAQRIPISDLQRKSIPIYQSIPVEGVDAAWTKLKRDKRLW
jgi:hypothetical protein